MPAKMWNICISLNEGRNALPATALTACWIILASIIVGRWWGASGSALRVTVISPANLRFSPFSRRIPFRATSWRASVTQSQMSTKCLLTATQGFWFQGRPAFPAQPKVSSQSSMAASDMHACKWLRKEATIVQVALTIGVWNSGDIGLIGSFLP